MKKILVFVIACLAFCGAGMAQKTQQRQYVTIVMTPDHDDWLYRCGEKVGITLRVMQFDVELKNQDLSYEWGMEMSPAEEKKEINTGKTGIVKLTLKGSAQPGFKTCMAKVKVGDREYTNYINVGFEPEKIQPTAECPKDFMKFWEKQLAKARKTELAPLFTLQPDLCTPYSDAYMVRYTNTWEEEYMYGMMRVPKGIDPVTSTKQHPAILEVPGAGVRPYKGTADDYAKAGIITLQMGIHGIPVNLPDYVYNDLKHTALGNYSNYNLDNKESYYYRRVYVGCVKAVDLLCSMGCVDANRIGVYGGSQGGALTIVVAALAADKIACASALHPALCELAGSQHGRIDGWPRLFTGNSNKPGKEDKLKTVPYYDVVNFARFVKAPMLFIQGYNDKTCPPTTTYSAYNIMTCEKSLLLPKDCAHWFYNENWAERRDWLIDHLTK